MISLSILFVLFSVRRQELGFKMTVITLRRCLQMIIYLCLITICNGDTITQTAENSSELSTHFDTDTNITSRQSGKIRFEDNLPLYADYGDEPPDFTVREPGKPFKFQEDNFNNNVNKDKLTFQDDNRVENPVKKRRRRRKQRYQNIPNGQGLSPNFPQQFGPGYVPQSTSPYQGYPGPVQPYPGYGFAGFPPGQYLKPVRRPTQSFASDALSSVTTALTSIALYDDYQCVPKLLCEAASGGSLGSSNVLQSVTGLQPLLTLLSGYSGLSSSPLFVFGKAVLLGMTNKNNPGSCRHSYPQCPSDPEKLVHYLNNHNGGFFRFFNAPHIQQPQGVQQFYNQLSIPGQQQNHGQFQNNFGQPNPNSQQTYVNSQPNPQGFGLQYPNYNPYHPGQQSYGFYNPYGNQFYQQNEQTHGTNNHQNPNYGIPNPYVNGNYFGYQQNYESKYPYQNYRSRNKDANETNEIQRRILIKPNNDFIVDDITIKEVNKKIVFEDNNQFETNPTEHVRGGKALRFPDESPQKSLQDYYNNKRRRRNKKK